MSEEPTKTEAEGGDSAAGAATLPTEVELKVRGKTLKVPFAKALELAQHGMVQAQNAERLAAERKDFESKAKRYQEFERFAGHLQGHPDAAKAVELALQDPAAVLNGGRRQKRETDEESFDDFSSRNDDGAHGRSSGADDTTRQELLALRQEISDLKTKDTQRDAVEAAGERSGAIDREIADYPWLKSPKMVALAKAQIAQTLAATPGSDLASVTAVVATDFREAIEAEKTQQVETARQKTQLRTERPARKTPIPGFKKPPTKEDLAGGKLLGPLKDMARSFGLPVD